MEVNNLIAINATLLAKKAFEKYDTNGNGYIEKGKNNILIFIDELERLFEDMGLKELHKEHFDEFLDEQLKIYDLNFDGVISYEEFIHIHNNLMFNS